MTHNLILSQTITPSPRHTGTIFDKAITASPGPCYDIRSASAFTMLNKPSFSLKSRRFADASRRSPAPNNYNTRELFGQGGGYVREKGDTYLERLQKTTNKVGPGMYSPLDPRTFQSKKVSGGTIRPRHELKNKEVRPAPNAYLPLL